MVIAAAVGGLVGAGILVAAYFVGVALFGAGIGALVANLAFSASGREPHFLGYRVLRGRRCSDFDVPAALRHHHRDRLRRRVDDDRRRDGADRGSRRAQSRGRDERRVGGLPLDPAPGRRWVPIAWIVLSLIGTGVQLGFTGGEKGRVGRKKPKTK